MKTFKVTYIDKDGKGLSTQHVRAVDSEDAKKKSIPPRTFDKVLVRQKESRQFI